MLLAGYIVFLAITSLNPSRPARVFFFGGRILSEVKPWQEKLEKQP
jgi:hypothetical protein